MESFIQPHIELWDTPTFLITTASDTEYVQKPEHRNQMITTQVAFSEDPTDCIVLEHPTLKDGLLPTWNTKCILSHLLGYEEDYDETKTPDAYLVWEDLLFFAPTDLLAGLFNDDYLCLYVQRHLKQDGRIVIDTGKRKNRQYLRLPLFMTNNDKTRYQLVIRPLDLSKIGVGSLEKIASSLGIKMQEKGKMDAYKKRMLDAYRDDNLRTDFILYGIDDACVLFKMKKANYERIKSMYETINLKPAVGGIKERLTTGSMVAGLFFDWLHSIFEKSSGNTIYDVEPVLPGYKYFKKDEDKSYSLDDLLKKCGVKYFANTNPEFTKQTNALVQGGRAKNERPTVISDTGVIADADLTSCYATILENLVYPVGLPFTYSRHESDKKVLSLGEFLKKHEKSLVPRLYNIVVSGKLKHHQTLVPSKIADNFSINEKYSEDDPKIDADFRLYTQEIQNGIITSDVLEVLKTVCNRNEWSSWMKLEVITAVWYPNYRRCEDPEQWNYFLKTHYEAEGNYIKTETKTDGTEIIEDKRTRMWVGIPIADFIKPFKDKRKVLKEQRNAIADKNSDEWLALDAQQNAMKLVCNTLYGVLASPYFPISNVVIANNITAAARTAVWCLSCAAGTYQSITDGGAYNLNQVRDWIGDKMPSMNTLSLWRASHRLERRHTSKLFTKPLTSDTLWTISASPKGEGYSRIENETGTVYEANGEGWSYLDKALLDHLKHFFRGTPELPSILNIISFTHKDLYESIVLHSQTNYQFKHTDGSYKTKARGYKLKGTPYDNETNESNIKDLFEKLAATPDVIPPYHKQTISQILKCNAANEMLIAKTPNIVQQNGLLAGDSILKQNHLRPISLSMFHWKTHTQWESWYKKSEKLKEKNGYGIELFFLHTDGSGSVRYETAIQSIQEKIDDGWMWVVDTKSRGHQARSIKQQHPYL